MKWLSFLNLSLLISNVAALGIVLQPQTIVGEPSLVLWIREATDPSTMDFDLRFVQGVSDVGLALANLRMNANDQYGNVSVIFPSPGEYLVEAVSGSSRNTLVGTSNEVTVVSLAPSSTPLPASSSTSAPSSFLTAAPSTSQTTQPTTSTTYVPTQTSRPVPTNQSRPARINGAAIAGGVIGALIFFGLLAALIIFIHRRRVAMKKRWSFHKDLMVRRRLSRANPAAIIPDMSETSSTTTPEDVEQGLPSVVPRPFGSGHIVASPKGPRPAIKRTEHVKIVVSPRPMLEPAPARTRRQQEIADRVAMLRGQIMQIRDQPESSHILDDMQRQMVWLREQEQSPWALHKTDVLPAGYARYMTP